MPNKEFLEHYPLYKKLVLKSFPEYLNQLPKVPISMYCYNCDSIQTYNLSSEYFKGFGHANYPTQGVIIRCDYLCMHCKKVEREFFVKIAEDKTWIMKVGQFPAWEISGEPNIEKMLGDYKSYYKKGLICESQGYGIGAFGYYRRIVEEIIDQLLEDITELLSGEEKDKYLTVLEKTKKTIVAQDKIELVKELLPPVLRPDGMNPLQTLHSVLSEGLHARSDEECLEYSDQCRTILIFLVNQISVSKQSSRSFSESMRKILEKRAKS